MFLQQGRQVVLRRYLQGFSNGRSYRSRMGVPVDRGKNSQVFRDLVVRTAVFVDDPGDRKGNLVRPEERVAAKSL